MKSRKGYTYLIHAENLFRFKIGCAQACERRLNELQTSSPVKLHLIAKKLTNDMYAEEKKWHLLFQKSRKTGEWFELEYEELLKITKNWKVEFGIHWENRTIDNLIVGNYYFISFDGKNVIKVLLEKGYDKPSNTVLVSSKKEKKSWTLYDDEVRESEASAIFNKVTM